MHLSDISQKESVYEHKGQPGSVGQGGPSGYSGLRGLNPTDSSTYQRGEDEGELLHDIQVTRLKEKNIILEERLRHKEVFINQMTVVQQELSQAFERCQAELEHYKRKSTQPAPEVREYLEEINELKHLVIRLEDKINEYERQERRTYRSAKQEPAPDQHSSQVALFKLDPPRRREKRSKTMAHQIDSSPEFKKFDIMEEYVKTYPRRICSFITQFMGMVECFSEEAQGLRRGEERSNIKRRLKVGWKWVKQVVGEWSRRGEAAEEVSAFLGQLTGLLGLPHRNDGEAMGLVLEAVGGRH